MKWTEISIPFLEDNADFVRPFLTDYEHGAWVEADLFGPLFCCVHWETPPAVYEGGVLQVLDDLQSRTITCWSANRSFKPTNSVCSHQPDLEIHGTLCDDDNWEVYGKVRPRFLKSKAGAVLKQKLMVAQLKEQKPANDAGRIFGATITI